MQLTTRKNLRRFTELKWIKEHMSKRYSLLFLILPVIVTPSVQAQSGKAIVTQCLIQQKQEELALSHALPAPTPSTIPLLTKPKSFACKIKEGFKSLTSQKTRKPQTATESWLASNHLQADIKDYVLQKYVLDEKLEDVVYQIVARERQLSHTHFCLYHANNPYNQANLEATAYFFRILNAQSSIQGLPLRSSAFFEKPHVDQPVQEVLELVRNSHARLPNYEPNIAKRVLAANPALFQFLGSAICGSNMNMSCSWLHFLNIRLSRAPQFAYPSAQAADDILAVFTYIDQNLKNKHLEMLTSAIQQLSREFTAESRANCGFLYQIFFRKSRVNNHVYLSQEGGRPDEAWIVSESLAKPYKPLDIDENICDKTTDTARVLATYIDDFERVASGDHTQLRICFSPQLIFDKTGDVLTFMYSGTPETEGMANARQQLYTTIQTILIEAIDSGATLHTSLADTYLAKLLTARPQQRSKL